MLKNKSFVLCLVIEIILALLVGITSGVISHCLLACMIALFILFAWRQYQRIHQLSDYLVSIRHGNMSLDIRDNKEGEFSILKNEMYKIMLKLTEQTELLTKDKTFLADSLSNLSHQLKTPLTSAMMMADLLDNDMLPQEKRREFIENIHSVLERIEWIVQTLLKLSKMDAGTLVFKRNEVLVNDVIRDAVNPLLISMELRNQRFVIEGDKNISFYVDRPWMTESITNILKNCMEHNKEGETIEITFEKNVLYTSIKITDHGCGIAKEDLPHIFKRFYKGKNSSPDSVGIGLALSKEIIMKQNGMIDVTSEENVGTTFSLKFYE